MMKNKTLRWVGVIALAYFFLATAFYVPYYNQGLYEDHFESAYEELGREDTLHIFNNLKEYLDEDYFGYDRTHLLSEFTQREVSHMRDVKKVIDWVCIFYYVSILLMAFTSTYLLVHGRGKEDLISVLKNAGFTSLIVLVVLGVFSLLDFSSFFTALHSVFFEAGTWTFSSDSLLITLFPIELFQEFARQFFIYGVVFSSLAVGVSYLLEREV